MVLPRTVLFPRTLMPLYIFEPRYRLMLTHALEHDRVFCIAMLKGDMEEAQSAADIHEVSGVGLVRACVGHEDGTSHLVLQGLARVHLESFTQEKPFRIAAIREAPEEQGKQSEAEALSVELRAVCSKLPIADEEMKRRLDAQIAAIHEPAALADIVANTFLQDAESRQQALEERSVTTRLRMLLDHLG